MAAMSRAGWRLGVVPLRTLQADSLRIDAVILAARGLTRQQIAAHLNVDERTVRRWFE